MKSFLILFLITTMIIISGCLTQDSSTEEPSYVNQPINGYVNIPDSGHFSFKAISNVKVYLISGDKSGIELFDFRILAQETCTTGNNGYWEFKTPLEGMRYHIIVDVNDDGRAEDVNLDVEAGTSDINSFIISPNESPAWYSSISLGTETISRGETLQIWSHGYTLESRKIHFEIWKVSTDPPVRMWQSEDFSISENFSRASTFKIPTFWASSSYATYYVMIISEEQSCAQELLVIDGNDSGNPEEISNASIHGRIIPANYPVLFNDSWDDFSITSDVGTQTGVVENSLFSITVPAYLDIYNISVSHPAIETSIITLERSLTPEVNWIVSDTMVTWKTGTVTANVLTTIDQVDSDDRCVVVTQYGDGDGLVTFVDTGQETDYMASTILTNVPIGTRNFETQGAESLEPLVLPLIANYTDAQMTLEVSEGTNYLTLEVGGI
ncbi:hypothetical protein KAJ27_25670 [bacterium]|nr:hypothetical protein [bacterium]